MNEVVPTPWLDQYPEEIPRELTSSPYDNLSAFIYSLGERYGDLPAFTNFETTLSFNETIKRAEEFAAYLQKTLGYKKGDRFAIMMPNLLQYPIAMYGCLLLGVEIVNVNPLYTARELSHQLKDANVRGILIAENFAHTLSEVRSELPNIQDIIITRFGDEHVFWKGVIINFVIRYIKKLVPNYQFSNAISYKEVMKQGVALSFESPTLSAEDVAMLQYTGGTTGRAKGAMLTHGNILSNLRQVDCWVGSAINQKSLICITPLPMYHIFCCTVNALCFPGLGMHSILITNPRDMKSFINTLKKHPFSVMTGLNTLFKGLMNQPDFAKLDFSQIKFVVSGGMPLEQTVSERWQEITGNVIIEGYGLTETSPIVAVNWLFNDKFTNGIGYPLPSTIVSIRNEDGSLSDEGEPGELWVKGPQVMQGYWNQTEETKDAITEDGWFKTGDMATMNQRGFLKIVDRKKDMILVSGFNVYPTEIEEVLSKHPDVMEVAVIGVNCSDSGERAKAFIVKTPNSQLTEADLKQYASENLTNYKRPKAYEFIEELPKSNVGKVLRKELVKREKDKQISNIVKSTKKQDVL